MTHWTAQGAGVRRGLVSGASIFELTELVHDWIAGTRSPLGCLLRRSQQVLLPRRSHFAEGDLFPLPFMAVPRLPRRGRARERCRLRRSVVVWGNMMVACLNVLFCGRRVSVCPYMASAPQLRMHASICSQVRSFLRGVAAADPCGEVGIQQYLKSTDGVYNRHAHIVPLGAAAGLPDRAGMVDTTAVIQDSYPELAAQCEDPSQLLLPEDQWPEVLPPIY